MLRAGGRCSCMSHSPNERTAHAGVGPQRNLCAFEPDHLVDELVAVAMPPCGFECVHCSLELILLACDDGACDEGERDGGIVDQVIRVGECQGMTSGAGREAQTPGLRVDQSLSAIRLDGEHRVPLEQW